MNNKQFGLILELAGQAIKTQAILATDRSWQRSWKSMATGCLCVSLVTPELQKDIEVLLEKWTAEEARNEHS